MNPVVGWGLAVAAVAAGYVGWGWRGVLLGVTVMVFWLLLQFSRSLRVLRDAGRAPMGQVANAVMLQSKLVRGMTLMQVLPLAGSLGRRLSSDPEVFEWSDAGGDRVSVEFARGKVERWTLARAEQPGAD